MDKQAAIQAAAVAHIPLGLPALPSIGYWTRCACGCGKNMNHGGPAALAAALDRCDTTSKEEVYFLAHKEKALQLGFRARAPKKKPRKPKKAAAAPAPAPPPALPPAAAATPV